MKAYELNTTDLFRYKDSVYQILREVLLPDSTLDNLIVKKILYQDSKHEWRYIGLKGEEENFNPYSEVSKVRLLTDTVSV